MNKYFMRVFFISGGSFDGQETFTVRVVYTDIEDHKRQYPGIVKRYEVIKRMVSEERMEIVKA